MKVLLTTLLLTVSSLLAFSAKAQYSTYIMPTPQNLSPLYFGPLFGSGIYYGATPPNLDSKNPVLVFVHGFTDLSNGWFTGGNDMYGEAYRSGHNCVFVAMTRGQGMWANGSLLASMIDDITRRYGVSDVVLVAHSNGGKASEVAMITHNRRNKVERVITLGSPFGGTELANLAETPGFGWVVDLVGLGGGTSTSTTYYMGGYARPLLDWSWRNQPGKFVNYGAWGYNNGSGVTGVAMTTAGNLLNWMGSGSSVGGNDGVTPYWSSTRPNGRPQWVPGHGNPLSRFNHLDVSISGFVWNTIRPNIRASLSSLRQDATQVPDAAAVNQTLTSRLQYLSSDESNLSFVVEPNLRNLEMIVLQEQAIVTLTLEQQLANNEWVPVNFDWTTLSTTSAFHTGFSQKVDLSSLTEGRYRLQSGSKFAAVIHQNKGVSLSYDNSHQFGFDNTPTFNVKLEQAEQYDLSDLQLKAVITHKNTLEGEALEEAITYIEDFKVDKDGHAVLTPQQHLTEGVYNLVIQAEHPAFQKTLVTGFVVRKAADKVTRDALTEVQVLETFPNPATRVLTININTKNAAQLSLYDVQGRLVYQQALNNTGAQQVTWNLDQLRIGQGTYFVELSDGENTTTKTVIVSK